MNKPFAGLIIMDGYGLGEPSNSNSVYLAHKPYLDYLFSNYPNNTLIASGEHVGLPEGQMGNSEVGHLNLGAGRIVYQSLTRINVAIKDGSFYQNKAFLDAIEHAKKHHSNLISLDLFQMVVYTVIRPILKHFMTLLFQKELRLIYTHLWMVEIPHKWVELVI